MNSHDTFIPVHKNGLFLKGFASLITAFVLTIFLLGIYENAACSAALPDEQMLLQAKGQAQGNGLENAQDTGPDLFRQGSGSTDAHFNIGKAALENHDYETAISAFDGILLVSPETAASNFNEAPAQNSSEGVGLSISKQFQAIQSSKKQHFISANIALGLDLDEDMGVACEGSDIALTKTLGNIVTVVVDRPEKTQTYTSTAKVNYLYKPLNSPFSWKMAGATYNAAYRSDIEPDLSLSDLKAGMVYQRGRLTWEIYGTSNRLNLNEDKYLQAYGAGSTLNVSITPRFQVNLDGKIKRKNYLTDDTRDAQNVNLTLSPIYTYGRNRLSLSFGFEHENAKEDYNSYSKFNGIATYEAYLPLSTKIYVSYWYQGMGYGDIYPLFSLRRDTTMQYITTGFSKAASLWKSPSSSSEMDLRMSYTYTRAESTVELDSYTKNVLSAGMSMVF